MSAAAGTGPLGDEIRVVVLATIALNLALGPVTFKIALSRVGETLRARQRAEAAGAVTAERAGEDAGLEPDSAAESGLPAPEFRSGELNAALGRLRDDLLVLIKDFQESFLDARTAELRGLLGRIKDQYRSSIEQFEQETGRTEQQGSDELVRRLRQKRTFFSRWLLGEITAMVSSHHRSDAGKQAFAGLYRILDGVGDRAKVFVEVEQEPHCFDPCPGDALLVRSVKGLKRAWNRLRLLTSGSTMRRVVPVRKLAKYHLSGGAPVRLLRVGNLAAAQPFFLLRMLQNVYLQIDHDYDAVIARLEQSAQAPAAVTSVRAALSVMLREIEEDLAEAERDLERYAADMRKRLIQAFGQACGELLEGSRIAGTFELPERRYRFSRIYKESEQARSRTARAFDIWQKYETGLAGAQAKHIEVVLLVDQVSQIVDESVARVLSRLDQALVAGVRAARDQCQESLEALRDCLCGECSPQDQCEEITRQQEKVVSLILDKTLVEINRLRESRELNAQIDVMLQRFAGLADGVPREYLVLDQKDLTDVVGEDTTPAEAKLVAAPFREATRSFLETEIARNLADANRIMFRQIDEAAGSMSEVQRFVTFNLRTAVEQLQAARGVDSVSEGDSHAHELVLGTLERAVKRLSETLEKIRELETLVHDQIIAHVDDRMRDLEALILQKSALDLRIHLAQKEAVQRGFEVFHQARRQITTRFRILLRRYRPWGREVVDDLKTALGLSYYTRSEILSFYDEAKLDGGAFSKLPYIYQKLFDIAPLENAEFLVAREDELRAVENAKSRWNQGLTCAVAVVGELGSGKTSFINGALSSVFAGLPAYRHMNARHAITEEWLARQLAGTLGMTHAESFADIEAQLRATPEKLVVVLEDVHHLFLRTLGGFDALKRMLLLIANTSRHVLWILSVRESSWSYMDRVLGISDYFAFVINMELIAREEVEKVILSRHRVSGFKLHFLPDAAMRERKKYRRAPDDEARQEILRKEFFDQLNRVSEGNILAAIFYWLRSLGQVQGNELTVKPLRPLDFGFLRDVQIDKLLALGMTSQHGSLSAREHSIIFGCEHRTSLATLTYLANVNLMDREVAEDGEARFSINRLVYREISKELRSRNILH
ncbi:MAG: hypothetical protein ABIG68_04820 [Acidobacteriota bacterium]